MSSRVRPLFLGSAACLLGLLVPSPSMAADSLAAAPRLSPSARVKLAQTTPEVWVAAFVQSQDTAGVRTIVQGVGGTVETVAGDVLTVRLRAGDVQPVRDALGPRDRLEVAAPVHLRLDRVREDLRVNPVHAGEVERVGQLDGTGVLVGIIDLELDLEHPSFRAVDGTSRVVALWDQAAAGKPPAGRSYGHACDEASLLSDACAHASMGESHGTHVTGIAAGSRVETSPHYGMAPGSDIAFVNIGPPAGLDDERTALTTAICDGAAWIFEEAERRGQPAVINMSLGSHLGPHDGSTLADACLNGLAGPGRILVAAAGNEGGGAASPVFEDVHMQVHASGIAAADEPVTAGFVLGHGEGFGAMLSVWGDPEADLRLRVGASLGAGEVVWSSYVTPEAPPLITLLEVEDGGLVGPLFAAGGLGEGGNLQFSIQIVDEDLDELEGIRSWFVEVSGKGRVDAFLDTTSGGGFVEHPVGSALVDSRMTIGYPAVAAEVLAVGSYVSRATWIQGGEMHTQLDHVTGMPVLEGALSGFSSLGPSRDPQRTGLKPDITAPGELVASAMAKASADAQDPARVVQEQFVLLEGTSMAAPAMAGVVALMLQADPELDAAAVREVLDSTARRDALVEPGEEWGRGKLDALSAVEHVAESIEDEEEPYGTTGSDSSGSDTHDDEPADDPAPDGAEPSPTEDGGCRIGPRHSAWGLWLLAVPFLRRRRRRCARRSPTAPPSGTVP